MAGANLDVLADKMQREMDSAFESESVDRTIYDCAGSHNVALMGILLELQAIRKLLEDQR